MFLGHFAASLLASREEPRLGLGTSLLASQLPDAVWPWLLLAGVETVAIAPGDTAFTPLRFLHYPWSHSLILVLGWGLLLGALVFWRRRALRPAVLAGALVASHWVLDVASHRPDMPVWPGGPFLGFGLWNSVAATLLVEGALFAGATVLYARTRRPGRGFWILIGALALVYAANAFGPRRPT